MFSTSWVSSWLCLELDLPDSCCFCLLQPHIPWARCKKLWFSWSGEGSSVAYLDQKPLPLGRPVFIWYNEAGFSQFLWAKNRSTFSLQDRRTPFSALIKCECMAKRLKVYRCIFDKEIWPRASQLTSIVIFYKVKVVESAGPQILESDSLNCGHQAVLWHYNGCELREWAISPSCRAD